MSVVELDGNFLRKLIPILVGASETADEIAERTSDEEILLNEAQTLTHAGRIVRIENPSERFRRERLSDSANKIAMAEDLEVEEVGRGGCPEPERIDGLAAKANDWPIKRNTDQF